MFGLNFSASPALRRVVFLSLVGLAGCGGANACCTVPSGVSQVGGVIPPGSGGHSSPPFRLLRLARGAAVAFPSPVRGHLPQSVVRGSLMQRLPESWSTSPASARAHAWS